MMELTDKNWGRLTRRVVEVLEENQGSQEATNFTELAVLILGAIHTPQSWRNGDDIPVEVDAIEDDEGFRWKRIRISSGEPTEWWQCTHAPQYPESELLEKFGPVWEKFQTDDGDAPEPVVPDAGWPTAGEQCPKCPQGVLLVELGDQTTVKCPRCGTVWMARETPRESFTCGATHPQHGWVCDRPPGHEESNDPEDEGQVHISVGIGRWVTIPESTVTFQAGDETPMQKAARALAFVNYLIDQGSAPGTATITKKMVNRARGRAVDLQAVLRELEKHS